MRDPFGKNLSQLLFVPVSLDAYGELGNPINGLLSSQTGDEFDLRLAQEYSDGEMAVYDSFDWRLFGREMQLYSIEGVSGRSSSQPVFFLRGKGTEKCDLEPPIACSPAPDAPRYPFAAHFADAEDGENRAADCLADVTKIRAFIERGRLRYSGRRYHLLDDIEKRIADLDIYSFYPLARELARGLAIREDGADTYEEAGPGIIGLLMLHGSPLRGYKKELRAFLQRFTNHESTKKNWYDALIRLSGATPLDYSSKVHLTFDPEAPVSTVSGKVIEFFFSIMRRNEAGIREDIDTEFLHDYRVALRRLRSFVSEIKQAFPEEVRKKLSAELKELFSLTTHVRDFDVLILKKEEFSSMIPMEFRGGLKLFFDWAEERRNTHLREFIEHLMSSSYEELMQRWSTYAQETHSKEETFISEVALGRIRKRALQVHEAMEELEEAYSSEKLHTLRIQCKKLRYLSEIFASLFPGDDAGPFIKRLKRLQDLIGDHHDAVLQQETLMKAGEELPPPKTELLKALGALTTRLRDRELELFGRIDEEVQTYMSYLETRAPSFLFEEESRKNVNES